MKEIVGVRFKSVGKIYYFSPGNIRANVGDRAIVETVRGIECGEVVIANREIADEMVNSPLKPIIRLADENDIRTLEKNKQREKDAFKICEEKIAARKLSMNLVDVECTFDNNKLLFYFTAENRVDFRELVKDLASVFRTRIELRQIGVRDEAKILGGLGICGREFCCKGYMGDFCISSRTLTFLPNFIHHNTFRGTVSLRESAVQGGQNSPQPPPGPRPESPRRL